MDQEFHQLAEVERRELERSLAEEFRKGAIVRFEVGDKRPVFPGYKF